MQTELILSAATRSGSRPGAVTAAVMRAALEFETDVKTNIQRSIPGGRTYKTTPIVRRSTRRNSNLGLRRRPGGLVVGYNFHRASRRGQPPAILSGRLINSIRSRRLGPSSARAFVGALYGLILDDPQGLDRPFFHSRARIFAPRFVELINEAYRSGS